MSSHYLILNSLADQQPPCCKGLSSVYLSLARRSPHCVISAPRRAVGCIWTAEHKLRVFDSKYLGLKNVQCAWDGEK
jgi:hypothetical protein